MASPFEKGGKGGAERFYKPRRVSPLRGLREQRNKHAAAKPAEGGAEYIFFRSGNPRKRAPAAFTPLRKPAVAGGGFVNKSLPTILPPLEKGD